MAVGREDHRVGARNPGDHVGEDPGIVAGQGVAHRIRQVDGGRASLDGGFDRPAQEVRIGAGGVFSRPLHVLRIFARQGDRSGDGLDHLIRRHAQLGRHVQFGGGYEGMDAAALGRLQSFGAALYIAGRGAGQTRDHRPDNGRGDPADALEVVGRGSGEARFHDVDAERGQGGGHADLLVGGHGEAGGLLAVPQGGVEYNDLVIGDPAEIRVIDAHG